MSEWTSQLAAHLNSLGVGPEVIVPACFPKSIWYTVSGLATLKAGGASVALDPDFPEDRLREILDCTMSPIVLTTPRLVDLFLRLHVPTVIAVTSSLIDRLSIPSPRYISAAVSFRNAAFVVFTSGSTGKPKGIVQEHGSFCSGAAENAKIMGASPGRRALQFAAHIFDASLCDIYVNLAYGVCLCIPSDLERTNDLVGFVNRKQVNQAALTPTVAQMFGPEDTPSLKTLSLAGEPLTHANLSTWATKVNLINLYGPAEATVQSSYLPDLAPISFPNNIGQAVGGHIWIATIHNSSQLVPVGAIGEILLEGPLLARGYLKDLSRTNDAFRTGLDFTGTASKRRIYRTGDTARYSPEGNVLYLGRRDTQIKLHGQRLEPAEVENHIMDSDLIQHTLVVSPSQGPCQKTLVAFFSMRELPAASYESHEPLRLLGAEHAPVISHVVQDRQERLRKTLPSYMIPTSWIALEYLPKTTSGKLDRTRLVQYIESMSSEALTQARRLVAPISKVKVTPGNQAERYLLKVVCENLNIPPESAAINESFISLGGMLSMARSTRCNFCTVARANILLY